MGIIIRNTIIVLGVLFCMFFGVYFYQEHQDSKLGESNHAANQDAKNAYTAAQAYFTEYPNATVSLSKLTNYGFYQSEGVNFTILSGNIYNLQFTTFHIDGTKTYTIDSDGKLSKQK